MPSPSGARGGTGGYGSDSFTPPSTEAGTITGRPAASSPAWNHRNRWKREDCEFVKHDESFSDWKVLVGPSDWKEHALGKAGAERFRVRNLPDSYAGPGVYELGVTSAPAWRASRSGFLKPQDVVVVYVGHTDNIRQRMQRYGQAGAHLEGPRSTRLFVIKNDLASKSWKANLKNYADKRRMSAADRRLSTTDRPTNNDDDMGLNTVDRRISDNLRWISKDAWEDGVEDRKASMSPEPATLKRGRTNRSPRGPGLFSEVFSLGCSIAYRWAATVTKEVSERVQSELMGVFDYAWNRGGDLPLRLQDILGKIFEGPPQPSSCCHSYDLKWVRKIHSKKKGDVGIHIAARKPFESRDGLCNSTAADWGKVGDCYRMVKHSPQMLTLRGKTSKNCEFTKLDIPAERCGVLLENGQRCGAFPVRGGKRCLLHKDTKKWSQKRPMQVADTNQNTPTYGATTPIHVTTPVHKATINTHGATGAETCEITEIADPSFSPVGLAMPCCPFLMPIFMLPPSDQDGAKRRGSLSFNTWLRTSEAEKAKSVERMVAQLEMGGRFNIKIDSRSTRSMEGSLKTVSYSKPPLSPCKESQNESPARREICGLRLEDGVVCTASPRPDRKRCLVHKGMRSNGLRSPRSNPASLQFFQENLVTLNRDFNA